MSETQSTTVAVRSSTDLEQLVELEAILLGQADVPEIVDDPKEIQREIMAQMLGAKSDEELESFGQAIGWRNLEGVPIRIDGFRWRPSDYEEGAPVYFVTRGVNLDSGELVVLTTGSATVLAQLVNLAKRGRIPGCVRAIKRAERATRAGFFPLSLVTPEGYELDAESVDEEDDGA